MCVQTHNSSPFGCCGNRAEWAWILLDFCCCSSRWFAFCKQPVCTTGKKCLVGWGWICAWQSVVDPSHIPSTQTSKPNSFVLFFLLSSVIFCFYCVYIGISDLMIFLFVGKSLPNVVECISLVFVLTPFRWKSRFANSGFVCAIANYAYYRIENEYQSVLWLISVKHFGELLIHFHVPCFYDDCAEHFA